MKMKTKKTEHDVYTYSTGRFLGTFEIDFEEYMHTVQHPEGVIAAGELLTEQDITDLKITKDTTVYCDD